MDDEVKHRHRWGAPFEAEWCDVGAHFVTGTYMTSGETVCLTHKPEPVHMVMTRECRDTGCSQPQVRNETSGEWVSV